MSGVLLPAKQRKTKDSMDFWATPAWATVALLKREPFTGTTWEPASGDGAMSRVLEAWGYDVRSSDLRADPTIYGERGVDFLKTTGRATVENIVTNPPFNVAEPFAYRALEAATRKVAFFLKIEWLESQDRYRLFSQSPLRTVYVFSRRVQMYNGLKSFKVTKGGMMCFAWYVWEQGYTGKPVLEWIPDSPEGCHIPLHGLDLGEYYPLPQIALPEVA